MAVYMSRGSELLVEVALPYGSATSSKEVTLPYGSATSSAYFLWKLVIVEVGVF